MNQERKEKKLILEVKNLHTYFYGEDNEVWKILEGINFKIYRGETLGILGPSGVGKSVLAQSIFNLVRKPGIIENGEIIFKGKNILEMEEEELIDIRGRELSLVMQNTGSSFDPLTDMTFTTSQPYRAHTDEDHTRSEIKMLVVDQLGKVAIPDPITISDKFAHQISGGEGQRIKIASAVINNPDLLIADEPVSNLDTTVARNILDLLYEMKQRYQLTMILIAHNLGVIAELSDYVAIMYAGKIVEIGDVESIFYSPRHPFTQGLFYATPSMAPRGKLKPIPGTEPDPRKYPSGCHYHPRCEYAIEKCKGKEPQLEQVTNERHCVACWRKDDIPEFEAQE